MYTRWLTRALVDAGARISLYVDPANRFWDGLASGNVAVEPVSAAGDLPSRLPKRDALVLTQSPLPPAVLGALADAHRLAGFAHMPMRGRSAAHFRHFARVFTVSRHCVALLREAGLGNVHDEPIYGTFELERPGGTEIVARSPYAWDRRKVRDRMLGLAEPLAARLRARRSFMKRGAPVLGVVSLISPIKQFPLLFSHLAPLIARHPGAQLEVFGSGGYAQVRDLRRALAPLGNRARFWGHQNAVQVIYPQLDYLMTGLPEKEALGLNALEAQACGTPVLAVDAPPFTETILDGGSGYLYRDPREDGGAAFEKLLDEIVAGRPRPDPRRAAADHLAQFSYPALVERARRMLAALAELRPRSA